MLWPLSVELAFDCTIIKLFVGVTGQREQVFTVLVVTTGKAIILGIIGFIADTLISRCVLTRSAVLDATKDVKEIVLERLLTLVEKYATDTFDQGRSSLIPASLN